MVRPIVKHPDPLLLSRAAELTEATDDTRTLIRDLVDTMLAEGGQGIAAPQVGVSQRVVVVHDTKTKETHAMVNPRIVRRSAIRVKSTEGCLSVPGVAKKVERRYSVVVEGLSADGELESLTFVPRRIEAKGLVAAVWQHETDHLDGITLADLD